MKRLLLILTSLFFTNVVFGQLDYYIDVDTNKRCLDLKIELFSKLNQDTYNRTYDAVYNFMSDHDIININNEEFIWDVYSHKPIGEQAYTYKPIDRCSATKSPNKEGDCWNREHVFPSSWFGGSSTASQYAMYTDIVNLLPTDGYVNAQKGNMPIAKVKQSARQYQNGSLIGTADIENLSGNVFEPIDEYKGDLARILLYMNVRYHDLFPSWSSTEFNKIKDSQNKSEYHAAYINILLEWHEQDPPSQKEIDRNTRIDIHQNNRNPFVDYPQLASYIWKAENCTPVRVQEFEQMQVKLYPNPAQNYIFTPSTFDNQQYYVSDLSGRQIKSGQINSSRLSLSELLNGTYFLFIKSDKKMSFSKFTVHR